jgi:hypothetical protein
VKLAVVSASLHGDGKASLGRAGGGPCDRCHGAASTKGAPAPDLHGNTDTTLVTVGMHRAHLQGSGGYTAPITCADCHKEPAYLRDSGHIDSDLPAEVTFSARASGTSKPAWDRARATCNTVHCHGFPDGKVTSWSWTRPASPAVTCNSCHGMPPAKTRTGGTHPSSLLCNTCHKSAYNSSTGALDPTKHINGKVEF